MIIEIVDLPIINGDFPVRYVNVYLPEGKDITPPFWQHHGVTTAKNHGVRRLHHNAAGFHDAIATPAHLLRQDIVVFSER